MIISTKVFSLFNHQLRIKLNNQLINFRNVRSFASYKQGQNDPNRSKIREYFYFIDHNGMLFLDDSRMKNFTSCFKEKVFLNFFFKNIKKNTTGRYEDEFPFLSLCGIERNFIRCDDVPIVFTHIVPNDNRLENEQNNEFNLIIAYSDLTYPFVPESLYMLPESINCDKNNEEDDDEGTILKHGGRIYHKAADKFGGYGLIRSILAQEIDSCFQLDDNRLPVKFNWKDGKSYSLSNELAGKIIKQQK